MAKHRLLRGVALLGQVVASRVTIGGGDPIKKVVTGTTALNPGSINSVTRGTVTFTLTGAAAGDLIHMQPPSALDDDLIFVGAEVTSANTVTVYLYNPTGGAIDDASRTWRYIWVDLT